MNFAPAYHPRLMGLVLALLGWGGCSHPSFVPAPVKLSERPVVKIPLGGDLNSPNAEISGMAWAEDHLILLPQFLDFGGELPRVFGLPRTEVEVLLAGSGAPLVPREIRVEPVDVAAKIQNFQGFEAIAVLGHRVWLVAECVSLSRTMGGYLIPGEFAPDFSILRLHPEMGVEVTTPAQNFNTAFEALSVDEGGIYAFFEANSPPLVSQPLVRHFDLDLQPLPDVVMGALNYRLTDSLPLGADNRTWVINYFYPGSEEYAVEKDNLAWTYGVGPTHGKYPHVERLIQLELGSGGFGVVAQAPYYLELEEGSRNWEGLVELPGKGFLMVTDKFPGTVLGFVATP